MHRRAFVWTTAGGLLAVLPTVAQPAEKIARIGFLLPAASSDPRMQGLLTVFRQGLVELGYVEGRTFTIEPRCNPWKRARRTTWSRPSPRWPGSESTT